MTIRWFLSKACLLHPTTLWLMMLVYVPGTVYGYYWYEGQLAAIWAEKPHILIPFVPDSPTASLLFAIALLWLWIVPGTTQSRGWRAVRGIVEALGVVTSVKYGLWATIIIIAGAAQGDVLQWEHWMLMIGHTAMAIAALLYARFFRFTYVSLAVAAGWTFLNDGLDYGFGIFPYLPSQLSDDLTAVCVFTVLLTGFSVAAAAVARFGSSTSTPFGAE